jgi:hypothetical protein
VARATNSIAVATVAIDIDCKRIEDIHIIGKDNTRAHPKRDGEDSIGGK